MIKKGEVNSLGVVDPECFVDNLIVNMKQVVPEWAGKLSKSSWKKEQKDDPEIGPIVHLLNKSELSQYKAPKNCLAGIKILLRFRNDLRLVDGLLYRKWWYKNEIVYLQFVLPATNRKKTVIACHDQFGHLLARLKLSGTILILSTLVVLISTSTVAIALGGILTGCLRYMGLPTGPSLSLASQIVCPSMVRTLVPSLVQCTPASKIYA